MLQLNFSKNYLSFSICRAVILGQNRILPLEDSERQSQVMGGNSGCNSYCDSKSTVKHFAYFILTGVILYSSSRFPLNTSDRTKTKKG